MASTSLAHLACLCGTIITPGTLLKDPEVPVGPQDTVKVNLHKYVLDTIDGGLTPLMLNLDDRQIPTWSAASQQSSNIPHDTILSLPRDSLKTLSPPKEDSYLQAKCHCGGVSLLVKRSNYTSNITADLPARYIPSDPAKWLSYFCACRSCRLSFGVSLTPWLLVLPDHVFNANFPTASDNTSSGNSDANLTTVTFGRLATEPGANTGLTLKHRWSSPDTVRSFCGKCGATISYWCEKRPDELDLAVGILRAEEGSMARRWLEWKWGQCSSTEESIDREICDSWVGSTEVMETTEVDRSGNR
ncbi:uncharacterized protein PAC_07958 [Phialocephala subalpina]|uniref:CENP-V/GFA domain-containing protein n=1 Tax=Phialocephala subalpina TaxID=576137 RepID=A0A1L7WZ70_9HELO|nr:uncharacterized protein PAC_07958 [Phialocephala subalpina]